MELKLHQLLVFTVEERRFGLFADVIVELVPLVHITPLPGSPDVIEGIIDIRGEVVPIYDLRRRLGLREAPASLWQHLIVARVGDRLVGLRVDRALDLQAVEASELVPVGELPLPARHLAGVAKLPDGLVVIHDLAAFLSPVELAELDAALAAVDIPAGDSA